MLLDVASDDLVEPNHVRRLLKELREVRTAKIRSGTDVLDAAATGGGGVALTGVGAMEISEGRGFIAGVVDGLRYVTSHWKVRSGNLTYHSGGLARPRNKHDESRWRRTWPTAHTARRRMTRMTWNSDAYCPFHSRAGVIGVQRNSLIFGFVLDVYIPFVPYNRRYSDFNPTTP